MKKEKVLLADDVELFLELEKSFFHLDRFDIFMARTGKEAFEVAVSEKPDIIFLDLYMPEMNGDEACQKIKSHPELSEIPVIMVTHPDEEELERCYQNGCDDILFKPLKREQFLAAANTFLESSHRLAPRVGTRVKVFYEIEGEKLFANFTVNMSTGGVFLESEEVLPEDTPLLMEFILPGGKKKVRCNGKVAWRNMPGKKQVENLPAGMGIQFVDLKLEEMDAIRQYLQTICEKNLPKEADFLRF
ncbi:MAG: response regulator [Deltaproteobacteria bacterium]|nr:response regulator [Deltaproteobacteria bacterium]